MTAPLRLSVEAMLREKARGLREVADLFDRAAEAPEGSDRGVLLDAASERLSDVLALSRAAALEAQDSIATGGRS